MRKRRGYLDDDATKISNLDSLVDIVSNKVGILIILAVFIAIFSLIEKKDQLNKEETKSNFTKIKIPWAHSSQKNSLLFLLKEDRLFFFDRALIFKSLKKFLSEKKSLPVQINLDKFYIKLATGNRHAHCIEFFPKINSGEWWYKIYKKNGLIQKLKKKYPSEENYFYFWVDSRSFSLFREIRESLLAENYEVGWKPIRKESTLRYCSGNSYRQDFQPQ